MTDIIDRAALEEERFLNEALAKHKPPENRPSYSHCEDCGEPIPGARQQAVKGCTRCVLCQEYEEKGWP